jgi:hypothetical protein
MGAGDNNINLAKKLPSTLPWKKGEVKKVRKQVREQVISAHRDYSYHLDSVASTFQARNLKTLLSPETTVTDKARLKNQNQILSEFRLHIRNLDNAQIKNFLGTHGSDILTDVTKLEAAASTISPQAKMIAACESYISQITVATSKAQSENKNNSILLSVGEIAKKIANLTDADIGTMQKHRVDFTSYLSVAPYFQTKNKAIEAEKPSLSPRMQMLDTCNRLQQNYIDQNKKAVKAQGKKLLDYTYRIDKNKFKIKEIKCVKTNIEAISDEELQDLQYQIAYRNILVKMHDDFNNSKRKPRNFTPSDIEVLKTVEGSNLPLLEKFSPTAKKVILTKVEKKHENTINFSLFNSFSHYFMPEKLTIDYFRLQKITSTLQKKLIAYQEQVKNPTTWLDHLKKFSSKREKHLEIANCLMHELNGINQVNHEYFLKLHEIIAHLDTTYKKLHDEPNYLGGSQLKQIILDALTAAIVLKKKAIDAAVKDNSTEESPSAPLNMPDIAAPVARQTFTPPRTASINIPSKTVEKLAETPDYTNLTRYKDTPPTTPLSYSTCSAILMNTSSNNNNFINTATGSLEIDELQTRFWGSYGSVGA